MQNDMSPSPVSQRPTTILSSFPDIVSGEASERYRDAVESYPAEYEAYLHRRLESINKQRRTIRLDLVLANDGTVPAAAISLTLTLSNTLHGHRPAAGGELGAPPLPPVPPWLEGQTVASDFQSKVTTSPEMSTQL